MRQRRKGESQMAYPLWRFCWVAVLILHLPLSVKVIGAVFASIGAFDAASVFALLATNLFFLLEIFAAPCRRALTSPRRVLAFLLLIALVHVGIVDQGLDAGHVQPWLLIATIGVQFHGMLRAGVGRGLAARSKVGSKSVALILADGLRSMHLRAAPQGFWNASPDRAPPA